ncbi:MAG TPA: hypothetical protein VG675_01520 [Bryobacteraceae bacterium]|nr:hypothetical protein [Bryobacteraceae bacterium]
MKSYKLGAWCALVLAASPVHAQTVVDLRTQSKSVDFSQASSTKPSRTGTTLPASCAVGETFLKTNATPGQNVYVCTAANVWSMQGNALPGITGSSGAVLSNDGTSLHWQGLGGDVSGTPSAVTVNRIGGRNVSTAPPSSGQALTWDGTQWKPQSPALNSVFGRTGTVTPQNGDYQASQVTNAVDKTTANTYTAGAKQTFVPSGSQAGLQITPAALPNTPQSGDVVIDTADSNHPKVFDGTGWVSLVPLANYSVDFTAQTTVTIPGTTHKLNTANLIVDCYDNATPAKRVEPDSVTIDPATFDVTVTFAMPQSGRIVLNASGGNAAGGGAVMTVFGRAGVVTAQSGDYDFSQIAGTIGNAQLGTGIDAAKIGAGAVTNTAFGYLANVSSDLQNQLNGKAALTHSHTAAGDVTGDLLSTTVVGLRNRPLSGAMPSGGQVLTWNAGTLQWEPQTFAGGGVGMAAQLGDLNVARTSATTLTVGANCSVATPCNVRVGGVVYSIINPATVTLSAGTGTAYLYVSVSGVLTAGHNLTLTCSAGCAAQSGITGFPLNSVPLYTWTATSGTWDATGGADSRAFLSAKALTAGTGIIAVDAGPQTTIAVDSATVPTYLTAAATLDFPSIATGACAADLTFPLAGAAPGDAVAAAWPSALEDGLIGTMRVSAANTVAVRLCNFSGDALNPASASYRGTIVRSF